MKRHGLIAMGLLTLLGCLTWAMPARAADDEATKKLVEYYRRKANVPPTVQIEVKNVEPAKIKGAKSGTMVAGGRSINFLLSDDGRYAIFGDLEDLTVDPFKKIAEKINVKGLPAKGGANATVVIVEYSDFQCPFCSRAHATTNQVLTEYGDKVRFYHKDFPLSFHPWAEPAAIAAKCVAEQKHEDAYWKLTDFFFANQKDMTPQNVKDKSHEALQGTKVDLAKFDDCFDNKKTADAIKADMAEAQSVGVSGTPAFFINGRMISGAQPVDAFKAIIDDELAHGAK
jgi:protein-disulfide isomerase